MSVSLLFHILNAALQRLSDVFTLHPPILFPFLAILVFPITAVARGESGGATHLGPHLHGSVF